MTKRSWDTLIADNWMYGDWTWQEDFVNTWKTTYRFWLLFKIYVLNECIKKNYYLCKSFNNQHYNSSYFKYWLMSRSKSFQPERIGRGALPILIFRLTVTIEWYVHSSPPGWPTIIHCSSHPHSACVPNTGTTLDGRRACFGTSHCSTYCTP